VPILVQVLIGTVGTAPMHPGNRWLRTTEIYSMRGAATVLISVVRRMRKAFLPGVKFVDDVASAT